MKLPVVDTSLPLLELFNPANNPLSNGLIELTLFICWVLTLVHALKALRAGDQRPLFAWLSILVYAVVLEVITYNYVDNFGHERFSVMLYHHKLPLYITFVYHTVLYTCVHFARRLGLASIPEAAVCGLFAVVMYTPYDLIGPEMPWWIWKDHLTTEARWLGVPYSSTLWMFLFHGALCWLIARRDRKRGEQPISLLRFNADVAMISVNTLLLGFVLFIPYHALHFAGLSNGITLILFLAIGCVIVALAQPQFSGTLDREIRWISSLWHGFFIVVLAVAELPFLTQLSAGALIAISATVQLLCGTWRKNINN